MEDEETPETGINSGNNVNAAVYGLKARDVLWGETPEGPALLPAVVEFRSALAGLSKQ